MKILFFVLAIFAVLKANAQNYLIAFTGSGASSVVDIVKVENLMTGETLTLNGSDILNLKGDQSITGIDDKNIKSGIKIYPNPMINNATIEVYPPLSGNAIISIFDMSGKQVAQIQNYLENSLQEFRLFGEGKGLYIVNVRGNNYQLSGKLICNGNNNGVLTIESISNNNQAIDKDVSMMRFKSTFLTTDMKYSEGQRLKFTGISGKYSRVTTGIIEQDKIIAFDFIPCTDGDGNNYPIVKIGTQTWMGENMKSTRYTNGKIIQLADSSYGTYYWYDDDTINKNIYGALYNWNVLDNENSGKPRGKLCPVGWHAPNNDEWRTLTNYTGGPPVYSSGLNEINVIAGAKLRETGDRHWTKWDNYDVQPSNETGFTAVGSGFRFHPGRYFSYMYADLGFAAHWWSYYDTGWNYNFPNIIVLSWCNNFMLMNTNAENEENASVRCVKD